MRPAEQESLLLRQVAALRRRGLSHVEALEAARPGVPTGALADRVAAASRSLAAGGSEPLDDVLARAEGSADAVELAAVAIDARLSADSALATVRLYFALGVLCPVLASRVAALVGQDQTSPGLAESAFGLLCVFGAVVVAREVGARFAPGVAKIRLAAALFDAAALGRDPQPLVRGALELTYFDVRRAAVGAPQAAAELGRELLREGERAVLVFRHLGPLVAAVVYLLVGTLLTVLVAGPVFGQIAQQYKWLFH